MIESLFLKHITTEASCLLNKYQLSCIVSDIYNNMTGVYSDVHQSHLNAASKCILQSKVLSDSHEIEFELTKAVTFLELAFSFAVNTRHSKFVKSTRLFGVKLWNREFDVIPAGEKRKLWDSSIIDICINLYLIYDYLGNSQSTKWRKDAKDLHNNFVIDYYTPSIEELKGLSPSYTYQVTETCEELVEYSDVAKGWQDTGKITYDVISPQGHIYIDSIQKKERERFDQMITNIRIQDI